MLSVPLHWQQLFEEGKQILAAKMIEVLLISFIKSQNLLCWFVTDTGTAWPMWKHSLFCAVNEQKLLAGTKKSFGLEASLNTKYGLPEIELMRGLESQCESLYFQFWGPLRAQRQPSCFPLSLGLLGSCILVGPDAFEGMRVWKIESSTSRPWPGPNNRKWWWIQHCAYFWQHSFCLEEAQLDIHPYCLFTCENTIYSQAFPRP